MEGTPPVGSESLHDLNFCLSVSDLRTGVPRWVTSGSLF